MLEGRLYGVVVNILYCVSYSVLKGCVGCCVERML